MVIGPQKYAKRFKMHLFLLTLLNEGSFQTCQFIGEVSIPLFSFGTNSCWAYDMSVSMNFKFGATSIDKIGEVWLFDEIGEGFV